MNSIPAGDVIILGIANQILSTSEQLFSPSLVGNVVLEKRLYPTQEEVKKISEKKYYVKNVYV